MRPRAGRGRGPAAPARRDATIGDRPPECSTSTSRRATLAVIGLLAALELGIATLSLLPDRWQSGGTTLGGPGSDCVVRRPDGLSLG